MDTTTPQRHSCPPPDLLQRRTRPSHPPHPTLQDRPGLHVRFEDNEFVVLDNGNVKTYKRILVRSALFFDVVFFLALLYKLDGGSDDGSRRFNKFWLIFLAVVVFLSITVDDDDDVSV